MLSEKTQKKLVQAIGENLPDSLSSKQARWWASKRNAEHLRDFLQQLSQLVLTKEGLGGKGVK